MDYFDSNCRIIIDEFNLLVSNMDIREKTNYAINNLCEADIVYRLGGPFRQMVRYSSNSLKAKGQDIMIDYKDFRIEVKYWRYWYGGTGKQKKVWSEAFQDDFDWLCNEFASGNKGKRAFIAAWSPLLGWNELLHLGQRSGQNPPPNRDRLKLLPFLDCPNGEGVSSIRTIYSPKDGEFSVRTRNSDLRVNWRLYGESEDFINIVIYY
ncbi:hypothetical protein DNHGIG_23940 [Collibacillus ludicampi]|uniref:Restriction endonuclease n=1 Tax=Collibacillus ludicampi TaxID=2771369 RepID=A0AAV4LGC9_9BACL|nr:hypothetical protein [Collibacillus ludicampi]GIM46845.1 hypothetical protein DNHGIG_23940 [Collibacillus ludicampi]